LQQARPSQQDEPSQQVFAPKALAVKANIKARLIRAVLSFFIVILLLKISELFLGDESPGCGKQRSLNQKDTNADVQIC
jgi:hypothetical protein